MTDAIDRISPTLRPNESPVGYQTWSNLLFLHWRVPVSMLRPLIPSELEIDTFDGSAWLGLVPFYMSDVRPWWAPAVPGISYFPETNLRTYVHRQGSDPAVWFLSLDAAKALAVWIARTFWHLNYFYARMSVSRTGDVMRYDSCRRDGSAEVSVEARILGPQSPSRAYADGAGSTAEPGTLEHFLAERYWLFSTDRSGRLHRGQVHHRAYPLRLAQLIRCQQTLTQANQLEINSLPEHVLFSPGVSVDIFRLRPV